MRSFKIAMFILIVAFAITIGIQSNSHALSVFLDDLDDTSSGILLSDGGSGLVIFNGSIGVFNVVGTYAITYPLIGASNSPELHLTNVSVNTIPFTDGPLPELPHTLQIKVSEQNFTGPIYEGQTGFILDVGGTTGGIVSVAAYLDDANNLFGITSSLGTLGPFSSGSFSGTTTGLATADSPFSLTLVANVTHGAWNKTTSLDAHMQPVPEPATLLLLGSGLLGMGIFGRKKFRKTKA